MVEDFMNEVFHWDVVKHGSVDVIQALVLEPLAFGQVDRVYMCFGGIK
jgi:hypothetical protein